MADEILNDPNAPKVLAQIVISVIQTAPGQTATKLDHVGVDEITAYGLLEKARQILVVMWAQQAAANQPRVIPANGSLAQQVRRLIG